MNKTHFSRVAVAVFSAIALLLPSVSSAQSISDIQSKIQALLAQIQQLQVQLAQAQGGGTAKWCHDFTTNLGIGNSGDEISALHTVLLKEGVTTDQNNNSGGIYDETLASAVSAFQEKYHSDILDPAGLHAPTGYMGRATRAKLNALYGCGGGTGGGDNGGGVVNHSITLLSPHGGDIWIQGHTYSITWSAPSTVANVTITMNSAATCPPQAMSSGSGPQLMCTVLQYVVPIAQNVPNTGSYTWTIPSTSNTFSPGAFRLMIADAANSEVSGSAPFTIVGPTTDQSSLTVTSPNGGETWIKGTTQTIHWQDNTPIPCSTGSTGFMNCATVALYDVTLIPYSSPCTTGICPMYQSTSLYMIAPYTIAKGVSDTSYSWVVGNTADANRTIPEGAYRVQVCRSGTNACDSSDSYFKIAPGTTGSNGAPKIVGIPAIPTSIHTGQAVNFSWSATDPDQDDLSWSVDWGDIGVATTCQVNPPHGTSQNWNYSASHSWANAGTYTVKVTVSDCKGGTDTRSSTIQVGTTTGSGSPVINGVSGPTILATGQIGTWGIAASDPSNGTLNYSVDWGDHTGGGTISSNNQSMSTQVTQNSTFTHSYASAGTYTASFTVTNNAGLTAQTTMTVTVTGNAIPMCAYTAAPSGCTYVHGSTYDPSTNCGLVLSCPATTNH